MIGRMSCRCALCTNLGWLTDDGTVVKLRGKFPKRMACLYNYMRVSQNSLSQSLDYCVIFLFWLKIYKLLMKRAPT